MAYDGCKQMVNVAKNESFNNNDDGELEDHHDPIFDKDPAGDDEDVIYRDD